MTTVLNRFPLYSASRSVGYDNT